MKKVVIILISFTVLANINAQENKKLFWGFSTSADFGRYNDRISIEPNVAYQILPKTYLGIGGTVLYYRTENTIYNVAENNIIQANVKDRISYLGANSYLRFIPFQHKETFVKNMFLQTSIEGLFGIGKYQSFGITSNYTTENYTPFVTIGYQEPLNEKMSLNVLFAFKLNNEEDSPYKNPVIRLGIQF